MTREEFDLLPVEERLRLINLYKIYMDNEATKLKKENFYCKGCHRYFARKEAKFESMTEVVNGECVFRDAGYGDDDTFADCSYIVLKAICPYCGAKIETARHRIGYSNERDRWGNPV